MMVFEKSTSNQHQDPQPPPTIDNNLFLANIITLHRVPHQMSMTPSIHLHQYPLFEIIDNYLFQDSPPDIDNKNLLMVSYANLNQWLSPKTDQISTNDCVDSSTHTGFTNVLPSLSIYPWIEISAPLSDTTIQYLEAANIIAPLIGFSSPIILLVFDLTPRTPGEYALTIICTKVCPLYVILHETYHEAKSLLHSIYSIDLQKESLLGNIGPCNA